MDKALIVVGLQFGDEGKGSTVDFLTREHKANLVVRFNGGGQAAHNVVLPDGRHHTFSQWGSGTFAGARTHLSKYMIFDPLAFMKETDHLEKNGVDVKSLMPTIDPEAIVVTPYHVAINRMREIARGEGCHGSCGVGIGETVSDSIRFPEETIRARDLVDQRKLLTKMEFFRSIKKAEFNFIYSNMSISNHTVIDSIIEILVGNWHDKVLECPVQLLETNAVLKASNTVIFEGAQGALLDERYGFHPHTTWSKTSAKNANDIIEQCDNGNIETEIIGVTRAYTTRHGFGPFPTECKDLSNNIKDSHNRFGQFQGDFRVGWLDLCLLDYAHGIHSNDIDSIMLTCIDRLPNKINICCKYENELDLSFLFVSSLSVEEREEATKDLFKAKPIYEEIHKDRLIEILKHTYPIKMASYGPTHKDKVYL